MRILSLMTYDVFRLSLGWSLESMGHQVYHLNTVGGGHLLEEALSVFQPEMVVTMGWDNEHEKLFPISPLLKAHNIFHLYFAEEDYLYFDTWSKRFTLNAYPNFVLTRSKSCIPFYKKLGVEAAYLDVGCATDFHRIMRKEAKFDCDVSVVDHLAYNPNIFLKKSIHDLIVPLFDQPFNTKIWGKKWNTESHKHFGKTPRSPMLQGILPFHLTPRVYSSSNISISPQTVHDQISNRTYDILCSGGFLLTSDSPGVREKLTPGKHCEVSGSAEETIDKIRYYLKHESKRQKISIEGYLYAKEKFSYKNTLAAVWPRIASACQQYRKAVKPVTAKPQQQIFHLVKKGDTLWKISKTYQVPIPVIMSMNKLHGHEILVNQVLRIK